MIQCPKCQSIMPNNVSSCETCGVLFSRPANSEVFSQLSKDDYLQEIQLIRSQGIALLKLMKIIGGLCLRHVNDAEFYLTCGQINQCQQSLSKAKTILKYKWVAWTYVALIILFIVVLFVLLLSLF